MVEYLRKARPQEEGVAQKVRDAVSEILSAVEKEGIAAVRRYSEQLDDWNPESCVVSEEEILRAEFGTTSIPELLGRAGERGAVALSGGCLDVGEGVLAYAPLVEALRPLAVALGPGELDRVLGGARAELARLVPELGPQATGRPVEAPLAPTRLFELLLGVLHRLAERGPVLLVVEDLHWADQSTRDLLAFLARNLRRERILVVVTYRNDEPGQQRLGPYLAELDRGGPVQRIDLLKPYQINADLVKLTGNPSHSGRCGFAARSCLGCCSPCSLSWSG
jgi:predicted ATPase